jgi:murein DD-endopeptidase MepM/ murein hydrolase activator NlpD/LysM repeat protein
VKGDVLMSGERPQLDARSDDLVIANTSGLVVRIENLMIALGSYITKLSIYGIKSAIKFISGLFKEITRKRPVHIQTMIDSACKTFKNTAKKAVSSLLGIRSFYRTFRSQIKEYGLKQTLFMRISEITADIRKMKKIFATLINYTVPVICVAVLIKVVTGISECDYGVSVECNGKELGIISTEDVLNDAQKVLSQRVKYYDTGSSVYLKANLSVTALSSENQVLDEVTLADAIQEQIPEQQLMAYQAELAGDENKASEENSFDISNKVRAFPVTVDGEIIGAVSDYSLIDAALSQIKSKYKNEENVIDVKFDKDIEYGYEQYVDPSELVDPQTIIDRLTGIVSEPVYYEVKEGDTPWDIAIENNMSVDSLKQCLATFDGEIIPDITEDFKVGTLIQLSEEVPFIQPIVTKDLTYTATIDYEIEKKEDDSLYKGETVVDVKGVEGKKQIHAYVTYKNGKAIKKDILSENVISEPITKVIRVGTKATTTPVSTGSGGSGQYFWPVAGGYISSPFGDGRGHKGIDIAAPYGTPIYAAASGTVTDVGSGWNGGYGNAVMITQDDGNVTMYAHQSSVAVSYGDYVVKGQLIGYIGSTGDSSGNHLHFEVRSNGRFMNPTDYVSAY